MVQLNIIVQSILVVLIKEYCENVVRTFSLFNRKSILYASFANVTDIISLANQSIQYYKILSSIFMFEFVII